MCTINYSARIVLASVFGFAQRTEITLKVYFPLYEFMQRRGYAIARAIESAYGGSTNKSHLETLDLEEFNSLRCH
jgi:hypothetical protein